MSAYAAVWAGGWLVAQSKVLSALQTQADISWCLAPVFEMTFATKNRFRKLIYENTFKADEVVP